MPERGDVAFSHCVGCGCVVSDWAAHKRWHNAVTESFDNVQAGFYSLVKVIRGY